MSRLRWTRTVRNRRVRRWIWIRAGRYTEARSAAGRIEACLTTALAGGLEILDDCDRFLCVAIHQRLGVDRRTVIVDHRLTGGRLAALAGVLIGASTKENALPYGQFDLLNSVDVNERIGDALDDYQAVGNDADHHSFRYRDAEERVNTVVHTGEHEKNCGENGNKLEVCY